jgi:predicted amidohydrolase
MAQWLATTAGADERLEEALEMVATLAGRGSQLVVLPELWPCAHDPADPTGVAAEVRREAEPIDGPRTRRLAGAARKHGIWLAAGTVPEKSGGDYFNTALLFSPEGDLWATHRKAHLYRPMNEDHAFKEGDRLTVCDTPLLGRVGLVVCYDGDFPEVARALRMAGARVVIQVDAYEVEAERWWDRLYPAHALANGQWWIMVNQCGTRGDTTFMGKSQIISPLGEIAVRAPKADHGTTPSPAVVVQEIALDQLLRRADDEAGELVRGLRPDLPVEFIEGPEVSLRGTEAEVTA